MADQGLAAETDQWDRDPWLLNTPAGTIDLRTCQSREPRRDDYCTRITSVRQHPDVPCSSHSYIASWEATKKRSPI